MLTNVCRLVVGLGLGLDLASGWLMDMHMHLYYYCPTLRNTDLQTSKTVLFTDSRGRGAFVTF